LGLVAATVLGCGNRLPESGAAGGTAGARAPVANPLADLALARAKHQADHKASIAAHRREPFDEAWSRETSATLRRELMPALEELHARLAEMDCRSATCLATIDFGSYADASNDWPALFATPHPGCSIEFMLDDRPESPTTPFEATFVYACAHGS
jgi:hypothetical protein